MTPMPNAFMTINLSAPSPAETPAAVFSPSRPLGDVAAGPIESSSSKGGNSEAPAVAASNTKAAGLHVKYAAKRREKAEEHRFVLDEAWFMAMLDEPPLFLQEGA